MTALQIEPLSLENFSIALTWEGTALRIAFAGNADMDARGALETFLKQLNAQVVAAKLRQVVCDMRDLYFMNSACFKCMVQWIDAIVKSDIEQQYSLNFIKNPKMGWQARSLDSLRHFGPAIVLVKIEP